MLVIRDLEIVGPQGAGHPRVERADREGEELVAEDVHPDDLGRHVAVAHGDEGATHPASDEVQGRHVSDDRDRQHHGVAPVLAVDLPAEKGRRRHEDRRLHAPADPGAVVDAPLDDELAGQGGDGQIEPFDAEGGDAEEGAHEGRHRSPRRQAHPEGRPEPQRDQGRRVGAHHHEGAVAQRDLPGVADEDVEPDGADTGQQHEVDERHGVAVEGEREQDQHRDDAQRRVAGQR